MSVRSPCAALPSKRTICFLRLPGRFRAPPNGVTRCYQVGHRVHLLALLEETGLSHPSGTPPLADLDHSTNAR